jgi:hypothetical protein
VTRGLALVVGSVVASCSGAAAPSAPGHPGRSGSNEQGRTSEHLVVPDILELEANGPVTNLHWQGVDSRVGGYQIGACILAYDAGMYQSGLEPDGLSWPDDYRYRSRPLGKRPVRWATWKKAGDTQRPGPYWGAVYVPGLQVDVACPTEADRERAVVMLETVVITMKSRGDLADVDPARGPAAWSAAPSLCTQTHSPPVGGFSDAVLLVESGVRDVVVVGTLSTGEVAVGSGPGEHAAFRAPAGTYSLVVTDGNHEVRCSAVELVAGSTTTVRVRRFRQ